MFVCMVATKLRGAINPSGIAALLAIAKRHLPFLPLSLSAHGIQRAAFLASIAGAAKPAANARISVIAHNARTDIQGAKTAL
jgi:hypothetical protein